MSSSFELTMQPREKLGTAASRRLRRIEQRVPVILYGQKGLSIPLSIEQKTLLRLTENDHFYSAVLKIKVEDKTYQAVLKALKRHPVKPSILDADFLRIDENKALRISVPLRFEGENVAPGVKQGGGVVSYQSTSVTLECLPKDIPDHIMVDITHLDVGQPVMLSQLPLPSGVSLVQGEDKVVVTILAPRGQSTASAVGTEGAAASK